MGRPRVTDVQQSFRGGLNLAADEFELSPTEIRRAGNARLTEFGGVTKRLGFQRLHASAVGLPSIVRGGFGWIQPTSTTELVIANGTLYTGTYGIPMTWTSRGGSFTNTAVPSFAAFRNQAGTPSVYVADGGQVNAWDGTTLRMRIASTPNVSWLAVYNRRLFGGGDPAQPTRVYWSALDNGDTLGQQVPGGGFGDIRTFGFQDLTGSLVLGSSQLLFHRGGISRFTGWSQDDIAIDSGTRGVTQDVGTIAPGALATVENVGFFLSDRGIYRVTEAGVQPVSVKIDTMIKTLDQTLFPRARAVHNKPNKEVLFWLPDVGFYVYNYAVDGWTGPWTGGFSTDAVYSLWNSLDATGKPIVLFGGQDGFIRRIDMPNTYLDDVLSDGTGGIKFSLDVRCRRFYFRDPQTNIIDPSAEKSLRFGYLQADNRGSLGSQVSWVTQTGAGIQTFAANLSATYGSGIKYGGFVWGGTGSSSTRFQIAGRGNYADFTISDDGLAASVYSRLEAEAFVMGRRA